MGTIETNRLYFGDCLEVMREDIPDESVDLVYLDPPFNSKRLYNAYIGGSQWVAFEDTWRWYEAIEDFHDVARDVELADTMEGLRRILGEGANLAYLSYMANRLRECWRVLKPTGSIYLHCDPTMSHYLKVVMDAVFDRKFRSEIIWKRSHSHNSAKRYGPIHDVILFYTKTHRYKWQDVRQPYDRAYVDRFFKFDDNDGRGRYWTDNLTGSGKRGGATGDPWRGFSPTAKDRHWMVPPSKLDEMDADDRIYWPATTGAWPKQKRYLAEARGVPLQDTIDDIYGLSTMGASRKERLGYPTQKPVALLERFISASSDFGDMVLDPFCGCGTTIHAAQLLGRQWIGIDVCVNACKVIEKRLREHFADLWADVEYIGMPKTAEDARELAMLDPFRFERWAVALVDGMEPNRKQRGDKGIDGRGRLPIRKGVFLDVVSQAKAGSTGPGHVQALNGARQQAGADLGIFTCFEDRVTANMRNAAASAGRFMDVPRVQIYTIEDYFANRRPQMPTAA